MRRPGDLAPQRAAGAMDGVPGGPATVAVWLLAVRTAATVRCVAIAYITVQVVIWHSFYMAGPWRLAGPAVAVAWGVALVTNLRRHGGLWLAGADSAVHVALALGAQWCVPAAMRGDTANWLYIVIAGQLVVPVWFAPVTVFVPLALVVSAAYWAGAILTPAAGAGASSPAAAVAVLLGVVAVAWCARRMLYGRAAVTDAALARADQDAREQYVVLSRNIERRELERLLHDTVLNTLTALARPGSGDPAEVAGRCRHDVTLMEYVLSDPRDTASAADAADRAFGGLLAGIEAVASEMRARGLKVYVDAVGSASAGARGASGTSVVSGVVAVTVAIAIARAVREALANVLSHAGTDEAWVEVSLAAAAAGPGASAAGPGGLQVTVRDAGGGFDAGRLDPGRLGLRRSIAERIADCGGWASVRSAPGDGTVVSMRWPAPSDGIEGSAAGRSPDGAGLAW